MRRFEKGKFELIKLGNMVNGRAKVLMRDGHELELTPGELFYVGPGHDSWVVSEGPYVSLHFLGAEGYAR